MGPVLSVVSQIFAGGAVTPVDVGGGATNKEIRRRNSMVFHITKFLTHEDDDYTDLLDMVKSEFENRLLGVTSNARDSSKYPVWMWV
jgi:hypothetical protein